MDPDLLTTLADEIVSASARVAAETRRLLSLIAEFDRLEGWRREGFSSCAEWLAFRTRLDKGTARERVRVARALARLPETDAAMSRGELSFSQVRALTRVADAARLVREGGAWPLPRRNAGGALADTWLALLSDEPRRRRAGLAARRVVAEGAAGRTAGRLLDLLG